MPDLRFRLIYPGGTIGPGKIALLEQVRATGSISGAGRALGMSYRRAWDLLDTMAPLFREPLVRASVGGRAGGGTELTPLGSELVARYRAMEAEVRQAALRHLQSLDAMASDQALDAVASEAGTSDPV